MIPIGEESEGTFGGGGVRSSVGRAQVLPSGPSTEDICQLLGDLSIEEKVMVKLLTIITFFSLVLQTRIMSVMARDHVLRTSNSSSGFSSHECDSGGGGRVQESNAAASVLHRSFMASTVAGQGLDCLIQFVFA